MSTATDPGPQPVEPSAQAATIALPEFFPPSLIVRQLSEVRQTQPVAALASANQHRAELTDVFLQAMERGVADPRQDFTSDGMLFNYAAYFLAKWRETRARPLFLRWFALPGEDAFELGGDTVTHDGARFLASVCGGEMAPLQQLIQTREAHPACRGQAIRALALLVAWGELSANDVESCLGLLASEGLERQPSQTWNDLAVAVLTLECRSLFSELRRAATEGLIDPALAPPESGQGEEFPPGALLARFAELNPPITDVINDTRWWAGFQREESPGAAGQTYIAPPKVGRNDLCPCGSGKKFKKCCGA